MPCESWAHRTHLLITKGAAVMRHYDFKALLGDHFFERTGSGANTTWYYHDVTTNPGTEYWEEEIFSSRRVSGVFSP